MNSVDLAFTPALEQARLIREKQISPLELTQLYLKRIEQLNPKLGAYVTVMAAEAMADAQAKTDRLTGSLDDLPPFFGVPIAIKDLNPVKGVPCAYGLKVACDRIATADDHIVTKIRQAGFVILGKTATSQLGSLPYTEPPGFPPARNPWNLDYTPGGSSGGSAAALAAGLCAIAQGSDGAGSLRGPAFCTGLYSIKGSRGRVSFAPVGERLEGMAINGPLGRTVADTAALLDAMSGYVTGDPYWLPQPNPAFVEQARPIQKRLRIAYTTHIPPVGEADAACAQAVADTAQTLSELGHHLEAFTMPDLSSIIDPFVMVWQSIMVEAGIPWFVMEKMNRWLYWRARFVGCGQYLRNVSKLQQEVRRIVASCEPYDAVLLPVYMHPTIRVGEWRSLRPKQILDKLINWVAPCPPFNASGQPAMAIPTGFDANGVPLGVQLVGRPADEATLFALAAQLETTLAWPRPPIATATEAD